MKVIYVLMQSNVLYFIECELKRGYSLEIICHELLEKFGETASHETIYKFIYSSSRNLFQYLLIRLIGRIHRKQDKTKRIETGKNILNRIDISKRPEEANNRSEFGHFEADSIESCKKKGKVLPYLTVVVERVSRYVHIMKTASKTALANRGK